MPGRGSAFLRIFRGSCFSLYFLTFPPLPALKTNVMTGRTAAILLPQDRAIRIAESKNRLGVFDFREPFAELWALTSSLFVT